MTSSVNDATLCEKLQAVEEVIDSHYRPEIVRAIRAALAVVAAISLQKRDHCVVLIMEGASGAGKSVIVRSLMPGRHATRQVLQRVDEFTPAAFVSNAANRTPAELDKIDLLPRIAGKVMLTKELAPLFRGDEKEVRKNFARLTSVLDGDGYKTNSGTHGERGYEGRFVFNWVGATTVIPSNTHRVMAQLGNRTLFYEVPTAASSDDELVGFAESYGANDAVLECQRAVNDFIEAHFKRYPPESVDPTQIVIPMPLLREVIRYAKLIAAGRVEVTTDSSNEYLPYSQEGPQRVILLLQAIMRGLALCDQRTEVNAVDITFARHIAFSSLPIQRREVLRAVLLHDGRMNASEVETALGVSRPTALKRMKELAATGLCTHTPGDQAMNTAGSIMLSADWRWLLETH